MAEAQWHDLGPVERWQQKTLHAVKVQRATFAITYIDGQFNAISGICNHVGGPLGEGQLEGEYIVCPWHQWKFHCRTGAGEPGFEEDRVPNHAVKVEQGRLWIDLTPSGPRHKAPHPSHPLARRVQREPGPVRVVGISTTAMDRRYPRYSGSDDLLQSALGYAAGALGADTRTIALNELSFRACEGYYSKSARACTWPCSITQMDSEDQLDQVYEALVHWADVVLLATPIRWGAASSLYYKMVERLNCVQNQVTTHNRVLIRDKVAAFIIVGGQDNIQAVAGQLLGFFAEIGFQFPPFPYIAHSRGWNAEDMEHNMALVRGSRELHEGAEMLAGRAIELSRQLVAGAGAAARLCRGGRKAQRMEEAEPA